MGVYQQGTGVVITEVFTILGVPTNPTTVTYEVTGPNGDTDTYVFGVDGEVTHPAAGTYVLTLPPPALPGTYYYSCEGTGAVVAKSEGNFTVVPSSVDPTNVDWAVNGPCQVWADSQDVEAFSHTTGVDLTRYAWTASQLLYELSGRRFSGMCEHTVRPCSTIAWCGVQVLSRGHVVGLGWDGSRWGDDRGPFCGCSPLSRVELAGYPVREILEVKINGDVVDASTYRLDGWRWLTRVRALFADAELRWPSCQALGLPDTEEGTFSITYQYGADPPLAGQLAAAQLAWQLYLLGANSDDCVLPQGVTSVTRQGVTFERPGFLGWAWDQSFGWRSGLSAVDLFLNTYNRSGLRRRPAVYSPDIPGYAPKLGR